MKKITKILSLVLVFSMIALVLASCGTTPEQRVMAAMAKMAAAKQSDSTATMKMKMDMGGMTVEVPATMEMKSDETDPENPIVYTSIKMNVMGQNMDTVSFYTNGYLYTESMGVKVKVKMSYEEMAAKIAEDGSFDFASIFEAKKDAIDESFAITENEDGTLTVKMTVTKEQFNSELSEFTNSIAGEEGVVEISDTVFEFTVDENNNISALKAVMAITLTIEGESATVSYDLDFKFNEVGEDFAITLPTDLDSYIG
ncbi:MAG: hypothetical protein IJW21_00810 [Clostridia bacterium]|nr:hypothetical protein [Clostridia bacterium]